MSSEEGEPVRDALGVEETEREPREGDTAIEYVVVTVRVDV